MYNIMWTECGIFSVQVSHQIPKLSHIKYHQNFIRPIFFNIIKCLQHTIVSTLYMYMQHTKNDISVLFALLCFSVHCFIFLLL